MDARETARWNGQLKIKKVRETYAATPVSKLVQRVFARHDALVAGIEDLISSPAGRSQGATLKKSAEELRAIAAALPVANALHALYLEDETDEQGSEKAYALRLNKTGYKALPAALSLAETRNVAKQAQTMKAQLASEADIDQADLADLDDANRKFGNLLAAPKLAREAGKTQNKTVGDALKAAGVFVKTDLRQAAETFKKKHQDFYNALTEAIRIDDAASAPGSGAAPAPAGGGSPA